MHLTSKPESRSRASASMHVESLETRALFAAGLTGSYFANSDFTDKLLTRVDTAVDFTWRDPLQGASSPNAFSAAWTGQVVSKFSEYYTFYTQSNGGVRLWVNGSLLIDDSGNSGTVEQAAKMTVKFLAKQTYNIKLEYVNRQSPGTLKLLWSSTRTAKQTVPTVHLLSDARAQQKYRISFRPTGSAAPAGYRVDNGAVFGNRGLGYRWGWDVDNSSNMFERNSSASPSERYDAGAVLNPNGQSRTWRIAVPNGKYSVRLVAGDAESLAGEYALNVEGVKGMRSMPTESTRWHDGTVNVTVTDGDIAISNAAGFFANKLNFVEITPFNDADRVVGWNTIGFSGSDPNTRFVNPPLLANGWQGYVDAYIKPQISRGARRIVLHNPFGISAEGYMTLDQYLLAGQQGLTWLTNGFVDAFKPITASGVEIIAYVGSFSDTPGFYDDTAQGWQNFWASIQPFLDAKMSIGFDGLVTHAEDDLVAVGARVLRTMDVKVYVEARPNIHYPWAFNFPIISIDSHWYKTDPAYDPEANWWAASNDQVLGEKILHILVPPEGANWETPGWLSAKALSILQDGYSPAVPFDNLTTIDQTGLNWLITRSNGYQPSASSASATSDAINTWKRIFSELHI